MITVKMTFGDLEFDQVAEARELVEKRLGKKITLEQLLLMLAFAYSVALGKAPPLPLPTPPPGSTETKYYFHPN